MKNSQRPDIPEEKIIKVNDSKKIDFSRPYNIIYFSRWFDIVTFIPFLICCIITFFCAVFYGLRVKGRKNLRILRKQGCITISNHCHYFDTVFANFVVLPKYLYMSSVQRNFEVPYVRRILRIVRAFPIPKKNGLGMIKPVVAEALKRKRHVHFLPEGNLVFLSQTIHRFRSGAFVLACLNRAPIVPMVYVLKRRKLFGKPMKPHWVKFILVIGEPIYPPEPVNGGTVPEQEIERMMDKASAWMQETIDAYHRDEQTVN